MKSLKNFKNSSLFNEEKILGGAASGDGTDTSAREVHTSWGCPTMDGPDCTVGDWDNEGTCK